MEFLIRLGLIVFIGWVVLQALPYAVLLWAVS